MSKNKVRKTVSLNKTDFNDLMIIKKIEQPGFNFNGWVRQLMIEEIRREEPKPKIIQNKTDSGIKIVIG